MRIITGESVWNNFAKTHTVEEHESMNRERYIKVSELLEFINKERDNGNIHPLPEGYGRGFSPALCLSRILEMIK